MAKSITHQFFFPHPPAVVWEYLTNPELIELWLMKNDFQPIVGQDFQFRTRPLPAMNFDGIAHCKVLELAPYTRLSYSWKGGPGDGTYTLDSIVLWQLQAKDNGTELLLEPNASYPAMKALKEALVEDGIPFTAFGVDDIQHEYERLKGLGVVFTMEPTNMGVSTQAIFDDTCGNLIMIYQIKPGS